ncbi:hypothetical protein [Saccharomonospora sp. CUA-673]|uniref:hypothetical protein n=1 Tax=Saccharomonospora sp. CUA-673 TaxID=1904969 RepID=UPI0011153E3E|nr:hypothetical protein [Saccharomonospora sp. CUA-673]
MTDTNRETSVMLLQDLLHEELARDRIRELQRFTDGRREHRRAESARRWHRVARWAARRAARYDR